MRFPLFLAAALAVAPLPLAAQGTSPDVASFLARANAVRAKGWFAMLMSSEGRALHGEARAASARFKAQKEARAKAGQPPISCPPDGAKLGPMTFLDELNKMPVAERSMSLADGMAWVSHRRFPCPASARR